MADPISEPVLCFAAVDVARPMDAKFLAELRDYTGIFAGYVLAGVVQRIFAFGNVFEEGRDAAFVAALRDRFEAPIS